MCLPFQHRPPGWLAALLISGLLTCVVLILASCTPGTQTAWNVVDYRLRKAFPPLLVHLAPGRSGSLAGTIQDEAGQPISGAIALVSTARGQVYQARSNRQGRYRIEDVPAGRYVPLAAAWGYEAVTGQSLRVVAGLEQADVDFVLPRHRPTPVEPSDLQIGRPVQSHSEFPEPMVATRIPFTFTLDGLTIDGSQIYLPAASQALGPAAAPPPQGGPGRARPSPLPTLVIIYPSIPLNWNPASVALTRGGYAVLVVGPDSDRALDIEGHVRDFRAVYQLWQESQLTPLGQPSPRWVAMSGSFGSLILFRALRDLPQPPPAIVDIGGVSDAFLGVQSLYSQREDLAIPPPYDVAVAALGRPDRDPAFFFAYSPVFFAEHLPPMFILHMLNDKVIPHNQAQALANALTAAGVPHELLLYEDTTHYLDARYPTDATYMVYQRVLDYVNSVQLPNDR